MAALPADRIGALPAPSQPEQDGGDGQHDNHRDGLDRTPLQGLGDHGGGDGTRE